MAVLDRFDCTGIFPVDAEKYPTHRFDIRLLKRYQKWVAAGKPKEWKEDLATAVATPEKAGLAATPRKTPLKKTPSRKTTPKRPTPRKPSASANSIPKPSCVCEKLGAIPCAAPDGMEWVPIWTLQSKQAAKSSTPKSPSTSARNKSFEERILDKIKGPTDKPQIKRRKCDLMTKVVTDKEFMTAICEKELEKTKPKRVKASTVRKLNLPKDDDQQQTNVTNLDGGEESNVDSGSSDDDEEKSSKDKPPVTERQSKTYLRDVVWPSFSPPVKEEEIVDNWFATIYCNKKKPMLYVGKCKRRFLQDKDGPVTGLEVDCLKPHVGSGNILQSLPSHLPADIDIFPPYNIISGPIDVIPMKGGKWQVPCYAFLKETFEALIKIDREKEFSEYIVL